MSKSNSHLSLSCLRHGTVFLMQVPLSGSTSSTMTNGASSRVTMDRWSSRSSAPEYSSKRGHTWYLIVKEPLSHLPTCMVSGRRAVWYTGYCNRYFKWQVQSDRHITEGENYKPGKKVEEREITGREKEGTGCRTGMIVEEKTRRREDIHPVPLSVLV